MSRIKFTVIFAVLAAFSLTACKPTKGTANPDDYFFLAQTALEGAKIGSMIGRNEAIKNSNFAGCVSAEVLGEAAGSAADALSKSMGDDFVIPAVSIDLEDCMAFGGRPGPVDREAVAAYVESISGVALTAASHYASKLEAADCRKGKALNGAIEYLQGLVRPISDEISVTDGVFEAPEVRVSLSECKAEEAE